MLAQSFPEGDILRRGTAVNLQVGAGGRQIAEGNRPVCTVSWFVPDERKAGGETVTATEKVRRIDPVSRKIILDRKKGLAGAYEEISLDRIVRIIQEDRTE